MKYYDIISRMRQDNALFSVLLELTYRCNLDCFICYNDRKLTGQFLSINQYFQLMEDLRDMQVLNLTLSGGEPLAHPDFWEIGARGKALGFVMRIKSNGHALRPGVVRRLQQEIDPYIIEISLHGASARTHDRQTQVTGSFDSLKGNLKNMQQVGLRVQLNCPLTRWAELEIEQMYDFADQLGYSLNFDPHISPRDDGDCSPQTIAPTDEGLRNLYRLQMERGFLVETNCGNNAKSKSTVEHKHCGTGATTLTVDPYGTVFPCVSLRRSTGSLHESSISEIWHGSASLREIRQLSVAAAKNAKTLGARIGTAGFCPGISDVLCGDPTVVHEGVYRVARLQQECLDE